MKVNTCCVLIILLFCSCSQHRQIETNLYFGLSKPGGNISMEEWQLFNQQHIATVFRNGYTVVAAEGKWKAADSDILLSEQSRLVIAIHPGNKLLSRRIDSIRVAYQQLFNQKSVLRVDKKVRAAF